MLFQDQPITGYNSVLHDQISGFADQVFTTEHERTRLAACTLTFKTADPIRLKLPDIGQCNIGSAAFMQQSGFIFGIEAAVDHPAAGIDDWGL